MAESSPNWSEIDGLEITSHPHVDADGYHVVQPMPVIRAISS